jgi:hypothetical protein
MSLGGKPLPPSFMPGSEFTAGDEYIFGSHSVKRLCLPSLILALIGACIPIAAGCGIPGSPEPAPAPAASERLTAEATAYLVVADSVYRRDTPRPAVVVVVDEPVAPQGYGPRSARRLVEVLAPNLAPETISDFWAVNEAPGRLSEVLEPIGPSKFQFVTEREVEAVLRDAGWSEFNRRYAGSAGFLRFSRVGLDRSRTEALLYFEHRAGLLGGSGGYAVLEHLQGSWQMRTILFIWQS